MAEESVAGLSYGEPFDGGLERAERYQLEGDFASALEVCRELIAVAGSYEDSPEVRLLLGHLWSDLGTVQLAVTDLPGAAGSIDQSLGLVRGLEDFPMGPLSRQLWLEILLKTLMARAELMRRTGNPDDARTAVDEATGLLATFDDPGGRRAAELGLIGVQLLLDRSEWGAAEELASALLSTVPEADPHLHDCLGVICASTGRYEPAEENFARADEGYVALGNDAARWQVRSHRAYAAMRAGELELAERLYAEVAAIFEQHGQFEDLAVCEQARAALAERRGDASGAEDLTASSLARFERVGAAVAAADTMLLAAQHAYDRSEIETMKRLAQDARDVYQERGMYERCAHVDLMLARTLEDNLNRTDHGDRTAESIATALNLALPAALALEAGRYDFATAHARNQWLELADEAMQLAFRLALRRQDQGLIFELVEHRCAGATLTISHPTPQHTNDPVFPTAGVRAYGAVDGVTALGGVAAEAAASVGLRVAPPPRVLMSAETGRTALQEYIQAAEFRYHRRIVSEEEVPFWIPTA